MSNCIQTNWVTPWGPWGKNYFLRQTMSRGFWVQQNPFTIVCGAPYTDHGWGCMPWGDFEWSNHNHPDTSRPLARLEETDNSVEFTAGYMAAPDEILRRCYGFANVSRYGKISEPSDYLIAEFDENAALQVLAGNPPGNLAVSAIEAGKFKFTWTYDGYLQTAEPTGFQVYQVNTGWGSRPWGYFPWQNNSDWGNLPWGDFPWADHDPYTALLPAKRYIPGRLRYVWESPSFHHDGDKITFMVRTFKEINDIRYYENNTVMVSAYADATPPAVLDNLSVIEL